MPLEMIILASGSPRRQELMKDMQLPFETIVANVEERIVGEVEEAVCALAHQKALSVLRTHPNRYILAADTLVTNKGQIFGKPRDQVEAKRMISALQGGWHEVHTGVCLIPPKGELLLEHCVTRVQFVPLQEEAIEAYIRTGESMDKAGAYAIQGIAGMFVRFIEGSYSNAIGLPTYLVREMLRKAGYPINI